MAQGSSIEWTEATWNPVAGCSVVSTGCTHCYAMRMAARLEAMGQAKYAGLTKKVNGLPVWTGKINLDEKALTIPLRTRKPTVWFVNSMSDLFHEGVPFEFVDKVFAVMALTPHHTYQILTKRPERMAEYLSDFRERMSAWCEAATELDVPDRIVRGICAEREDEYPPDEEFGPSWSSVIYEQVDSETDSGCRPLRNVWLGTSCERQKEADERIPHLLRCPAAVRFLSCEPLLGPISIPHAARWHFADCACLDCCERRSRGEEQPGIDWVIVGGESGPGARPMDVAWARSIVGQCKAAGVAAFVKQLGAKPYGPGIGFRGMKSKELGIGDGFYRFLNDSKGGDISEFPEDLRVREFPGAVPVTAEVRQ